MPVPAIRDTPRSTAPGYAPAQQRVLDLLGRGSGEPAVWPEGFLVDLADALDQAVAGPASAPPRHHPSH